MQLKEFCEATGATPRQIDLWSEFLPEIYEYQKDEGSGNYRNYLPEAVPRIRTLADLQFTFYNKLTTDLLRQVYVNYHHGVLGLGLGFALKWEVDDNDRIAASSTGRITFTKKRKDSVWRRWFR